MYSEPSSTTPVPTLRRQSSTAAMVSAAGGRYEPLVDFCREPQLLLTNEDVTSYLVAHYLKRNFGITVAGYDMKLANYKAAKQICASRMAGERDYSSTSVLGHAIDRAIHEKTTVLRRSVKHFLYYAYEDLVQGRKNHHDAPSFHCMPELNVYCVDLLADVERELVGGDYYEFTALTGLHFPRWALKALNNKAIELVDAEAERLEPSAEQDSGYEADDERLTP